MAIEIGRRPGPERPPVTLPSTGWRVWVSMRMAGIVLQMVMASAPPSTAARAIAVISGTFGASLASSGRSVLALTEATAWAVSWALWPKRDPSSTLGQLRLSSIARYPVPWAAMAAISPNWSTESEAKLRIQVAFHWPQVGVTSRIPASIPGLVRPMAFRNSRSPVSQASR